MTAAARQDGGSMTTPPPPRTTAVGRRALLGALGVGALGIVTGAGVQRWLSDRVGPLTDGTPLADLLPTNERFRIYTVTGTLPWRPPEEHVVRVGGLVDRPRRLSHADLRARPPAALTRDFQCVTGWRVSDVAWSGVRLRDLLDEAGAADAPYVRFTSYDGAYHESLTMAQARRDDVLVALDLDGRPLTRAHGGPARLLVAPMYGYKSLKWLDTIEVVAEGPSGYWGERGYDHDAWVGRSNGRTDPPTS